MDPGAVLEIGTAACSKLDFLVPLDPEAALGAIVSEEIPNVDVAVKHLCPQYSSLTKRAVGGFGNGAFDVGDTAVEGKAVARGSYVTVASSPDCAWEIRDSKGKVLDTSKRGGDGKKESVVSLGPKAASFQSSGCYAWVVADR